MERSIEIGVKQIVGASLFFSLILFVFFFSSLFGLREEKGLIMANHDQGASGSTCPIILLTNCCFSRAVRSPKYQPGKPSNLTDPVL